MRVEVRYELNRIVPVGLSGQSVLSVIYEKGNRA